MGGHGNGYGCIFCAKGASATFRRVGGARGGGAVRHGTPIAAIYKDGGWARAQRVKGANSDHFWA